MIHITGDYYIGASDTEYRVLKDTHSIDKKTNENKYDIVGHYTSITTAIKCCRNLIYRDDVRTNSYELDEALQRYIVITKELNEKIEKVTL